LHLEVIDFALHNQIYFSILQLSLYLIEYYKSMLLYLACLIT